MTSLYDDLVERIGELHFRFVPTIDPTGSYSDAEYDDMRAFRLLVHAEIERYLERLVEDALSRLKARVELWTVVGIHSDLLGQVVSYADEHVRKELIRNNHGVRKKNILQILRPLGINGSSLDNIWLETMDSYGLGRGSIAHNSQRATTPIDPLTEQDLLYIQILPELRHIEELVTKLS